MNPSLTDIITRANLRSLAGGRSFERGEDYFESAQVGPIKEARNAVAAKVHGNRSYDVRLKVVPAEGNTLRLDHSCTCPMGNDGAFCKHCVALGLAWIAKTADIEAGGTSDVSGRKGNSPVGLKEIRKWLADQEQTVLLDLLMEQVKSDAKLREGLVLKISRENARGIDLTAWKRDVRAAFHTGGHVSYYDASEYAEGVGEALLSLERLLKEGFAEEAMVLAEYAAQLAEEALQDVDDSAGHFWEIGERIATLHLEACRKAKPDHAALAQRLFALEMAESELDLFDEASNRYKNVLGVEGLAEFRRLAEAEWAKVTGKGSATRFESDSHRRRITGIMEVLAKASGDVDALIGIKKRDLSSSSHYLDIAEICKKAKRFDEALEWAEKGLTAFKDRPDNRLRDFLAEEYHRRKRHADAYGLYRIQFCERPQLDTYQKFVNYAKKIKRDDDARTEAIAWLRKEIEKEKAATKRSPVWFGKPDHSRLVEIFLWEKDLDWAWQEAQSGGCRNELWRKLADLRGETHPGDSAAVYRRLIEPVIDQKKNDAYADAVGMLKKIGGWMKSAGQEREFAAYYAELRLRHKPKRNLMKLLEKF